MIFFDTFKLKAKRALRMHFYTFIFMFAYESCIYMTSSTSITSELKPLSYENYEIHWLSERAAVYPADVTSLPLTFSGPLS